eukprot:126711_1
MSSCDTNYALSCLQKLPALSGLADEAKKYHRSDVFGDMYLESFQLHDEHDLTEYITATLTQFFDQVIEGSLSLDVAVMKMMMVMDYTNYPQEYVLLQEGEEVEVGSFDERYTVDQVLSLIARGRKSQQSTLRQVLKDNLFNNLKVLLHFMFVSVFGMSANQMIIDKNCTNNKLYEYFICEYVPKFRKDHIWFKYKKVLEILRKKQKAHHFFIIKAICDRHGIRRKGRYDASYMYRRQMPPQTDRQIILQAQDDSDIIQHLDCYDALQRTCVVTTTSKAREHRSNAREP